MAATSRSGETSIDAEANESNVASKRKGAQGVVVGTIA